MGTQLKLRSYYEDLYDKHTVEHCRDIAAYDISQGLTDADFEKEGLTADEIKELGTKVIKVQWLDLVKEMSVFMCAADRYNRKEDQIAEWMRADKAKDDFYEGTHPPLNVECRKCQSTDLGVISKDLFWRDEERDRVLFMFKCNQCDTNSAYFDDGEKWNVSPTLCPVCKRDRYTYTKQEKNHILTITYTCQFCDNTWTETLDFTPLPKEKPDPYYHEDRKLYCYSEKVRDWAKDLKAMGPILKQFPDEKERQKQALLKQKLDSIQKLTVAQMSERLSKLLKKHGFTDFQLGAPNTDRELVVPFTLIDSKADRTGEQSRSMVWKLVSKSLENTNWRPVRSSLEHRLGYVKGRLKGYEGDFEFKKLLERSQKR